MLNVNAKKWVTALRSGLYQRGEYNLKTVVGDSAEFCCLGVACELYLADNPGSLPVEEVNCRVRFDGQQQYLPHIVRDWLGLRTISGNYRGSEREHRNLTFDNDYGCKSFVKIADIIESEPDGLFMVPAPGSHQITTEEKAA